MIRADLDWLTEFLDANSCRYVIDSFSHDLSDQEMLELAEQSGVTFIKTQVVSVGGRRSLVAVRSKNLLDPEKVKTSFQGEVEFLQQDEVSPPFDQFLGMEVLMDQSVATAKAIKLRVSPGNDFLRMDFQDFKRLFKPRMNNLHMSSFRAGLSEVVPASAARSWELKDSCFIGVSLDNANFEGPRLDAVLRWTGKHFRRACILVADSIHRITLQIADPLLSEEQARQTAVGTGRRFVESNQAFFQGRKYACQFEFVFCSELEKLASFRPFYDDLRRLFVEHERFHLSVESFAQNFVEKKFGHDDDAKFAERVALSIHYFLEELALCACLVKEGDWPVLVYPGSLTVFTDMIEDGFDSTAEVVVLLRSLVSLSLNLKGD